MFENHASYIMMDITRRIADAVRSGERSKVDKLVFILGELEELFPEAKAELEERYKESQDQP